MRGPGAPNDTMLLGDVAFGSGERSANPSFIRNSLYSFKAVFNFSGDIAFFSILAVCGDEDEDDVWLDEGFSDIPCRRDRGPDEGGRKYGCDDNLP